MDTEIKYIWFIIMGQKLYNQVTINWYAGYIYIFNYINYVIKSKMKPPKLLKQIIFIYVARVQLSKSNNVCTISLVTY